MLILSRHLGETIVIGDNVTITVLSVKGNKVRMGIDAPRSINVCREEIYKQIKTKEAKKEAKRRLDNSVNNEVIP